MKKIIATIMGVIVVALITAAFYIVNVITMLEKDPLGFYVRFAPRGSSMTISSKIKGEADMEGVMAFRQYLEDQGYDPDNGDWSADIYYGTVDKCVTISCGDLNDPESCDWTFTDYRWPKPVRYGFKMETETKLTSETIESHVE